MSFEMQFTGTAVALFPHTSHIRQASKPCRRVRECFSPSIVHIYFGRTESVQHAAG